MMSGQQDKEAPCKACWTLQRRSPLKWLHLLKHRMSWRWFRWGLLENGSPVCCKLGIKVIYQDLGIPLGPLFLGSYSRRAKKT